MWEYEKLLVKSMGSKGTNFKKKNGSPCQLKLARRPVKKVKIGLIGFEFRQIQKRIDIEVIISNAK